GDAARDLAPEIVERLAEEPDLVAALDPCARLVVAGRELARDARHGGDRPRDAAREPEAEEERHEDATRRAEHHRADRLLAQVVEPGDGQRRAHEAELLAVLLDAQSDVLELLADGVRGPAGEPDALLAGLDDLGTVRVVVPLRRVPFLGVADQLP